MEYDRLCYAIAHECWRRNRDGRVRGRIDVFSDRVLNNGYALVLNKHIARPAEGALERT